MAGSATIDPTSYWGLYVLFGVANICSDIFFYPAIFYWCYNKVALDMFHLPHMSYWMAVLSCLGVRALIFQPISRANQWAFSNNTQDTQTDRRGSSIV